MHLHLAIAVQTHLGHLGHVSVVAFHQRDTQGSAFGQWLTPTSSVSSKFEDMGKTGLTGKQAHAVFIRVFARGFGQLVHETLVRKRVHVVADRTPVAYANAGVVNHQVVLGVGNAVTRHCSFGHEGVQRVYGQTKGALRNRLRSHFEMKSDWLA